MKRLLILLLLLLGSAGLASARDSVKGWCEEGNQPVKTSGLNSTTRVQASHPSCTITVYIHGGGLATIYADNNNTPLANPFTAQSGGRWQAYADDGRYDVTMSSAGFTQTVTYSDIILCDPFVPGSVCAGGGGGGGGVGPHNLLSTTHLDTIPATPPVRGDLITGQNQTSPTGVNPSWARLPLGTNGQVLMSNGTDAVWGVTSGLTLQTNHVVNGSQSLLDLVQGSHVTITDDGAGNVTISSTPGITSINTVATGPNVDIVGAGLTSVSTAGNTVTVSSHGSGTGPNNVSVQTVVSASYTVSSAEAGWTDIFNNGSGSQAVTLPAPSTIDVPAFIADRYNASPGTCTNCSTSALTQSAGHTLVLYTTWNSASTVSSVTDTAGDTWTKIASSTDTGPIALDVWQAQNIAAAAGSNTVTVHFSGSTSVQTIAVAEYATTGFDSSATTSGNDQNVPIATIPINFANEVALGFYYSGDGHNCPAGWVSRSGTPFNSICDRLLQFASTSSYFFPLQNAGARIAIVTAGWTISGKSGFNSGWEWTAVNGGTGLTTITPQGGSLINGRTTLVLAPGESCHLTSDGVSNYFAHCLAATNLIMGPNNIGYPQAIAQSVINSNAVDGTTTMLTLPGADAFYSIQAEIVCRTSVVGTETLTFNYTDTSNTAQSIATNAVCNALGANSRGTIHQPFRAKAGTQLSVTSTHSGSQPTFDQSVVIYQLTTQ